MGIVTGVNFMGVDGNNEYLMARVGITLDGYLKIKDISIIKQDGEYKVVWPKKKINDNSRITTIIPTNEKIRERIENVIINKYKKLMREEC